MMLPLSERRQRRIDWNFVFSMQYLSLTASRLFRILAVAFILYHSSVNGSSASSRFAASPIQNFEPSWAAASAQGTTIALSYSRQNENGGHGIVVLLRSPSGTSDSGLSSADADALPKSNWIKVDGLRVSQQSSDKLQRSDTSPRWTMLGKEALCCMTGLTSDVDYLSRVLQKQLDVHRIIYEENLDMPALKVVRSLASLLQEAAQNRGGRPYGIQSLIVGRSSTRSSLHLYSLDPSGGFRHWGSATAIGRNAQTVRKQLHKAISNEMPSSGGKGLETALRSSLDAMREAFVNVESDYYEALVVWQDDGQLCVGVIDPEQVQDCLKTLQNETDSRA